MKLLFKILYLSIILHIGIITTAQNQTLKHFSFQIDNRAQLDTITRYISIDEFDGTTVTAYANLKEWNKFLSWGIIQGKMSGLNKAENSPKGVIRMKQKTHSKEIYMQAQVKTLC